MSRRRKTLLGNGSVRKHQQQAEALRAKQAKGQQPRVRAQRFGRGKR